MDESDELSAPVFRVNRPKNKSRLRKSVAADDLPQDGRSSSEDEPAVSVKRKTPTSNRLARPQGLASYSNSRNPSSSTANTASRPVRPSRPSTRDSSPPVDQPGDEASPSYSAAYLAELRASNVTSRPSTRKADIVPDDETLEQLTLAGEDAFDLAAQTSASAYTPLTLSHIPSQLEIEEKLSRRRRLAAEDKAEDFISLTDSPTTSESRVANQNLYYGSLSTATHKPSKKPPPPRITRPEDDDANLEDAEAILHSSHADSKSRFSTDVSRAADERLASAHRAQISESIAQKAAAEDEVSSLDSDIERARAFERQQTRAGVRTFQKPHHRIMRQHSDGESSTSESESESEDERSRGRARDRTPEIITPLPTLKGILEGLREQMEELERKKEEVERRKKEVAEEKEYVLRRREEIEEELAKSGRTAEELMAEKAKQDGQKEERGLESWGLGREIIDVG